MDKGLNTEEVSAVRNFGLERIRLRGVEMKQKGDWYAAQQKLAWDPSGLSSEKHTEVIYVSVFTFMVSVKYFENKDHPVNRNWVSG